MKNKTTNKIRKYNQGQIHLWYFDIGDHSVFKIPILTNTVLVCTIKIEF